MRSWYAIRAMGEGAEIAIYDEIGAFGVSARGFLAELGALADAAPLTVRLNSPGGSVFDAVAIHNALKRHEGPVTVWIDGIAASAASYVAMAGDEVVMPQNAFLMIHDPAGLVAGPAAEMRAMAEALDKIAATLAAGYAARSGAEHAAIAALMAAETWLDAAEAVALGLADRVAAPTRIAARFDVARFRNAPPELVEAVVADPADADTQPVQGGNGAEGAAADILGNDDDVAPTSADPAPQSDGGEGVADADTLGSDAPPARRAAVAKAPPDAGAIRAEALAHARAVVDLCALAGAPERAAAFLAAGTALDAVRAALLAARAGAAADAGPEIDPRHAQPGRRAAGAGPWGEVIARTFRLRG